jgi:hypothetical protein
MNNEQNEGAGIKWAWAQILKHYDDKGLGLSHPPVKCDSPEETGETETLNKKEKMQQFE